MSADLEMVKTYIKYLKSFCPTPEEREFLEKHKKDILENDYYHALVNESIRKNNYNEEYYKKMDDLLRKKSRPKMFSGKKKKGTS